MIGGRRMAHRSTLAVALALVLAPSAHAQNAPPPAVTVTPVVSRDVSPKHKFIGQVQAIQQVQVHALVQGILQEVAFKEGSDVKAGQLLFVIEPDVYQAQLEAAQAQLAKAVATLKNDELTVARYEALAKHGDVPQATLDQAVATRDADAATAKAAEANVKSAQINLGYTRITSPIDGRIGAALVTKGNLVSTSTGTLATVVQLDPIRVVFSVNDRALVSAEQKSGSSVQELTKQFQPQIQFSNGTTYGEKGRLAFVSNEVDQSTGTIPVYAEFPNPQGLLLPGQYVNVLVQPEQPEQRLLVPVAAVQEDKQGKFVLVVGPDNRVHEARIKAAQQFGQDWVVEQGLKQGEEVVVEGLQKVKPGQTVTPQQASASESPAAGTSPQASR